MGITGPARPPSAESLRREPMNQEAIREVGFTEVSDPAVMSLAPVVSVHMITYNHGPCLAKAIEGVIAQKTDFLIELLIGEDCSTDSTREIALDYQRRYPHLIRVIYSDRNVGMMANLRRVWGACRGEFVAFCEGDDYWIDQDKLREQVVVLSRLKNIDIAFHSCYRKYENEQKNILSYVRSSTDKVFTLSEVIAGSGDFMPTASLVVRRSLLISIQNWFDATMPPVGDYFIQIFGSRNGGAYYVNKPMSVYRKDVEVAWSETTEKTIDAIVKYETKFLIALRKLEHEIPGQEEALKRHIVAHYSRRFLTANNENFTQIRELVLSSLKYLYTPKAMVGHIIEDERLESEYFLKLAVDSGKTKDLADQKCGVSWQFMRVARSLFEYGASVLRMINKNQPGSSECERTIAKWEAEAQSSYLIARLKRPRRLIIGNIR